MTLSGWRGLIRADGGARFHHRSGGACATRAERAFLREAQPWGLIIFKRNISTLRTGSRNSFNLCRDGVGWHAPVLVDQEGGRVQRLGPPQWAAFPPGARYGEIYDKDRAIGLEVARLAGQLIANDLGALGIDVDCMPIADVPVPGGDPVIGDRAYGHEPGKVAAIGGAMAGGLTASGVLPVLKHLPGTAAPPSTATTGCPWSTPTGPPWKKPILPPSGRSPACRSA